MKGKNDLAGRVFGDLVCVEPTEEVGRDHSTVWNCKCVCGRTVLRSRYKLLAPAQFACDHRGGKLRGEGYIEHAERRAR